MLYGPQQRFHVGFDGRTLYGRRHRRSARGMPEGGSSRTIELVHCHLVASVDERYQTETRVRWEIRQSHGEQTWHERRPDLWLVGFGSTNSPHTTMPAHRARTQAAARTHQHTSSGSSKIGLNLQVTQKDPVPPKQQDKPRKAVLSSTDVRRDVSYFPVSLTNGIALDSSTANGQHRRIQELDISMQLIVSNRRRSSTACSSGER